MAAALEKADVVGATVRGSGIMMEFLYAFYGLRAWDDYADPAYFDKLLLTQDKKAVASNPDEDSQRLRTRANKMSQAAAQAHVFLSRSGKNRQAMDCPGRWGLSTANDERWLSRAAVLVLTFAGTTHG